MSDAQGCQVKNEGGAMNALDKFGVLMNRHVVDERILDARADGVPSCAVVLETAQDYRLSQDDLYRIMVVLFFADCDDVAGDVGVRIPARSERVGDDPCSLAGGDEKKIMTEVLNRGIDIRRIGKRHKAAMRHIRVAAGGVDGKGKGKQ